jgi:hypothetical protein
LWGNQVYIFGSARSGGQFDLEHSDLDLAVREIALEDFYSAVGKTMCALVRETDLLNLDAGTAFGNWLNMENLACVA